MKKWALPLGFTLIFAAQTWGANYVSPLGKFTFQYDASKWEVVPSTPSQPQAQDVDKTMQEQTLVTLQRILPDKEGDTTYYSRFSIVLDDLKKVKKVNDAKDGKLAAYENYALNFMKSQRFDILSDTEKKLPGVSTPAFEIVAHQRDFGLTFKQVGFINGENAYLLTATTRTKKFEQYEPELKTFFETFQFTK